MKNFFSSTGWQCWFILTLTALLGGCGPEPDSMVTVTGETMGTTYTVKMVAMEPQAVDVAALVDERLRNLNAVMSTYIPSSELSRLNQAGSGTVPVSPELEAVLAMSDAIYQLSDGAFDVTVGPLVNLWGFGPDGPANGVPDSAKINEALSRSGFSKVTLGDGSVERPAGIYVDLSAIAKGYAVDEVCHVIESLGATRYMVEIGGEVRTRGLNAGGTAWVIGLEAPDRNQRRLLRTIPVKDKGMATSGDYRNFFEHGGKTYSHTIDPKTGWPVTHNLASVTVLHDSAAMADGLATAFSVMGVDASMRIAEEMNLPVLAIIREPDGYRERYSSEMRRYLDAEARIKKTPAK